jgi:hypothetical protein
VLISKSPQFIFFRTFRTGGTSIARALAKYSSEGMELASRDLLDKHLDPATFMATNRGFCYFFKFVFVRNPWDVQVSQYHHFLQNSDHYRHELVASMKSFDRYIEWRVSGNVRLQSFFCYDSTERELVNFIGRYERLQVDFKKVCDLIGIDRVVLPVLNSSMREDYREYYSRTSRQLIYSAYRRDIELFRYKF